MVIGGRGSHRTLPVQVAELDIHEAGKLGEESQGFDFINLCPEFAGIDFPEMLHVVGLRAGEKVHRQHALDGSAAACTGSPMCGVRAG